MIATQNEEIQNRLMKLRNHGATAPFTHDELGYNSRLDEVQAALLRIKLRKLEQDVSARIQVADWYDANLNDTGVICPSRPQNGRHAFNLYTIRHNNRDVIRDALKANSIGHSQCYPKGLHLQDIYSGLGYKSGDLPVTDQVCEETLSLPIFPDMREEEVVRVCEVVKEAIS